MEGEKGSDRAAMEAARVILDEVANVLDSRAQVECEGCSSVHVVNRVGWPPVFQGSYPEMEVLWLLTKAWNCGIHQYR